MAKIKCPNCDFVFQGAGWASFAVATLVAAPAVPDMATQVRCPKCQHVFAEGDVRHLRSTGSKGGGIALAVFAIGLVGWAVYRGLLA